MHENTHRANKRARQTKYRHLASNSQISFTNTAACGLLRPGLLDGNNRLKIIFLLSFNRGRTLVLVQTNASFHYRNAFTCCVYVCSNLNVFCESNTCTPVSLFSDKRNRPKCWVFWGQNIHQFKAKMWLEKWWNGRRLCSYRLALGEKQKTNTQYTGQIQSNPFYKSKCENI